LARLLLTTINLEPELFNFSEQVSWWNYERLLPLGEVPP
jgi:hypothetical protein